MDECELCGRETANSVVDHCHECGAIRGRLCRSCNRRLTRWNLILLRAAYITGLTGCVWDDQALRYLDGHYPGERYCRYKAAVGIAYRHWVAAGRPEDWWNTYTYGHGG
jgi:hypothetical protein